MAAVAAIFHPAGGQPLSSYPTDRLVFGRVGGDRGEETVVRRRSDRSLELHCHGGHAAVAMVERLLVERGCRPATWPAWAGENSGDPTAAAALVALAEARTVRAASVLLDQYHGALRWSFQAIRQWIVQRDLESARREVERLLARAPLGRHLTRPWHVVLTGPPNVGKSSLLNALVGYQRAIIHPAPGTTRDVVTATTALEGWPVEISDTAGLRATGDAVEKGGMDLACQRLSAADLVVLVLDATQPDAAEGAALISRWPDALVVRNKCDLLSSGSPLPQPGLPTSALRGDGIEELLATIARRLVAEPPNPGDAVPFIDGDIAWLGDILASLSEGDAAGAQAVPAQQAPEKTKNPA
jgi:tRNA modification GTPase